MAIIKEILTTENIKLLDLNISLFILFAMGIIIIICVFLKINNKPIVKNLIKVAFISLSIITFLFAFLNALTGEYLFSQTDNIKIYMLIATVALLIYLVDTVKELFTHS